MGSGSSKPIARSSEPIASSSKPIASSSESTTDSSELIICDRNGDAMLHLNGVKILASSAILSQKSSAFAGMFSAYWREGQAIRSVILKEIDLSKNHTRSFTALCMVLHDIPPTVLKTPEDVFQLAYAAHLYNCANEQVKLFAWKSVQRTIQMHSATGLEEWYALMVAAWASEHERCFQIATKELVIRWPLKKLFQYFDTWDGALVMRGGDIYKVLNDHRYQVRTSLHDDIRHISQTAKISSPSKRDLVLDLCTITAHQEWCQGSLGEYMLALRQLKSRDADVVAAYGRCERRLRGLCLQCTKTKQRDRAGAYRCIHVV